MRIENREVRVENSGHRRESRRGIWAPAEHASASRQTHGTALSAAMRMRAAMRPTQHAHFRSYRMARSRCCLTATEQGFRLVLWLLRKGSQRACALLLDCEKRRPSAHAANTASARNGCRPDSTRWGTKRLRPVPVPAPERYRHAPIYAILFLLRCLSPQPPGTRPVPPAPRPAAP